MSTEFYRKKMVNLNKDILLPHFKFNASLVDKKIPKYLFQTYILKEKVPKKVHDNISKYASDYTYFFYDDSQCRDFLYNHFIPEVLKKFDELKGAHKADLFRYCILYIFGGVYLDIKTILVRPLKEIFHNDSDIYSFYSVLSIVPYSIYQGILAVSPLNDIMKHSINFILNTTYLQTQKNYVIFTEFMFKDIQKMSHNSLNNGYNILKNNDRIYLFREFCCDSRVCPLDRKDRYGLSCNVINDDNELVFRTRYSDFPW
jgi:hypothetical protein